MYIFRGVSALLKKEIDIDTSALSLNLLRKKDLSIDQNCSMKLNKDTAVVFTWMTNQKE